MKARTILNALLKESISTEMMGIVHQYEETLLTEFIRHFFICDYEDASAYYYRFKVSEGDYFYLWHDAELVFPFGETYSVFHYEGQFLYIIPLDEE